MGLDRAGDAPATRGRVVMLVDNGVNGDSRVQKVARSAAAAGWDVVLLGRMPASGGPQTWRLGDAEVRLVPVPDVLAKRRHEFRRAWLRWPLAYPPTGIAAHRSQTVRAWRADLRVRRDRLALAARDGRPAGRWPQARLRAEQLAATVIGKWVSFRHWQLTRARKGRRALDTPVDRAYTRFWLLVRGDAAWRRLEPALWDWDLAFGKVIDQLAPDLIHAHDFRMLGVGARAAIRARAEGRPVKLVWDAHEWLPGLTSRGNTARWMAGNCAHEREYAPVADAVVTVSEALAELLQERHRLAQPPVVVRNAPDLAPGHEQLATPLPDLRVTCGLDRTTPLVAYCGGATAARGVDIMIEALPELAGVHLALVSVPPGKSASPYLTGLLDRAAELGVADRVHLLPFVPHWQVSAFLAPADLAVSPLLHVPNHEIALSNKFFEYSHARLPVVTSDVRTMAEMVRRTGQGEVYRAGDLADYLRAVRTVLADPQRYRAAYEQPGLLDGWTWQAQERTLAQVYDRLLPPPDRPAAPPVDQPGPVHLEPSTSATV